MIFCQHWEPRGHTFGTCMTKPNANFMYVNIPKNASSWTKPNLIDLGFEFYNYHFDKLDKHVMVVLRDPVDRWLSGICEYFTLYHRYININEFNNAFYELLLDQVTFDDHTEKQVYFIEGIDTKRATFFLCDSTYRTAFTEFLFHQGFPVDYSRYDYQHTTENRKDNDDARSKFKKIFAPILDNPKYVQHIKNHFKLDYELINTVNFYKTHDQRTTR